MGALAVVTGAAGGLGAAFANQFAARGYRLLLVDRDEVHLTKVCNDVSTRHGVEVECFVADLCARPVAERLADRLRQAADLDVLVNNAGFGAASYFVDTEPERLVGMVDLHVAVPVLLTRSVLPGMMERNRGAIINLSSVAAWLQNTGNVLYGSTKHFLAVYSEALQQELHGTNVRVQALCPGFVRTEFHNQKGMAAFKTRRPPPERLWMSADEVVAYSLRRLDGDQVIVIPGFANRVLGRLVQMPIVQPLARWLYRYPRETGGIDKTPSATANTDSAHSAAHPNTSHAIDAAQ
jgi:hypothetical protein